MSETTAINRAEWIDGDGYPTLRALDRIEAWPGADPGGCLEFVAALWWPDGQTGVSWQVSAAEAEIVGPAPRYLRLATGGWSGNEELLEALETNPAVWWGTWRLSASGGLRIFACPGPAGDRVSRRDPA